MSNTEDTNIATLSDEEREILAFWRKQERQQKLLAQQIKPRQPTDNPPLSFAQQRLWVVDQMADTGAAYTLTMGLQISGSLNIDVLEKSLGEIVRRHEVLRSSIALRDGQPYQLIHPPAAVQIEFTDVSEHSPEQLETATRKFHAAAGATVFDLAQGPLMRSYLLRLKQQQHILVICMHHIVTDGWSFNLLQRELLVLYEAYLSGNPSPLVELPVQYADYAAWQRNLLAGDEYNRQLDYWRNKLKDLTTLELPTDRIRPALPSFKGSMAAIHLEKELKHSLVKLAQQEDVTLFILLLTVFTLLLHKYNGQDDIVLGSPVANRSRIETEGLIGFFVNMLVLRSNLSGNPGFRDLLKRVRDTTFEAYEHQDLPIERMVEELKTVRDMSRNPLFQVSFALQQNQPAAIDIEEGLSLSPVAVGNPTVRFDLELYVSEGQKGLDLLVAYNTDLFNADTIERMLGHFQMLLEGIVAEPNRCISELPMLGEQERQQVVSDWNQTKTDYPSEQVVQALFEEQVSQNPGARAVEYDGDSLSYTRLNESANRLAHYLRQLGVGPEVKVGLFVERSLEMVIALLGILKAGGAYVPLDLDYPSSRIAFMIEDAEAPVLLTTSKLAARLPEGTYERVCLDTDWAQIARQSADNPEVTTSADSLAYVIYTSGSTGTPKGVEIPHRAICRLVRNTDYYQADASDRIAQASSVSFDAATFEIWGALLNGALLVGIDKNTLLNSRALAALLREKGITAMFITTAVFNQIAREVPDAFQGLSALMFGGEAVDPGAVRRVLASNPPERLLHVYGPTESTTFASWYPIESVAEDATTVPIGRPLANTTLYVLDANRRPVPVGVSGELYIGGDGLARGYLNQAELTAERFVPNPFDASGKLYRTGDKVRFRADGAIEFQGRFDHQIKLRGFRIELGEIETVLNRQAGIDSSVVVLHEVEPGDARLVAYLVAESSAAPTGAEMRAAEIRELMREHLPEYMLPSAFVMLDKLPLNANGKVDRGALPAPQDLAESLAEEYAPPRSELEEQLSQIWADVLKLERLGVHDNFFDLGGHSLMATQVVSRIREKLDIEVPLSDLFAHPTIAELAPSVELLRSAQDAGELQPIEAVSREAALPLSFPQQRLWYLDQLEPENLAYNIPGAIKLTGALDIEALRASLQEIINRHEVLRTTFNVRDGQAVQDIRASFALELPVEDLSAVGADDISAVLRQRLNEDALQPFNLATGPMIRSRLLRLGKNQHVLIFTLHHIVTDGWSFGILFRELGALYTAFCHRRPNPLPDLQIQYADFAAWQRQWLSGEVLQAQLDYWTNQLADIGTLNLPTDRPRPAIQTFAGAHASLVLGRELSAQLQQINRRQAATPFMTLLSVFSILLGRYCNQQEIVVGTPVANRNRRELEDLVGFFVNTLVIRTDVAGDQTFCELLSRVKQITIEALHHQDLPFEALVDAMQPERDRSRNPLFQVLFAVQNAPAQNLLLEGLTLESMPFDAESTRFDLELHIWQGPENLFLNISYNTDLFDAGSIERLLGHYQTLLHSICANPDGQLRDLKLLSAAEYQQLVVDWNRTDLIFETSAKTVHELFEAQVERSPQAPALEFEGRSLTYHELNGRANQLAHYLRERGVGAGSIVGICLQRGIDAVASLLAVFKAGGGYLPLDPGYPEERLGYMLEDSGAGVLLTSANLAQRFSSAEAEILCLDEATAWRDYPQQNLDLETSPERTAYVIYTSGSTGRPKGIVMPESVLCNLLQWQLQRSAKQGNARTLQYSAFSFDVSFQEIFSTLTAGGTLVLVNEELRRDPERLLDFLDDARIDRLFIPFAGLNQLAEVALLTGRMPHHLREIITAGEALQVTPALEYLFEQLEDCSLDNQYGPSETHVVSANRLTGRASEWPRLPDIGCPIANAKIYLLDEQFDPVPVGVPGELYIGGACLADGYIGQAELTSERFISNPFSDAANARLYRTGDLARIGASGSIQYLGRADSQVKLRGYRIELGEVESVIMEHADVKASAAMIREDDPGNERLVAYVVKRQHSAPDAELLRQHIRGMLPDYMLPSAFVFLETLPTTPSGKVDRKALPRPQVQKRTRGSKNKPETEMEIILANIWEELLEIEDIETDDMFFDLGGHSLLTIKVIDRFAGETNVRIPVASFMSQTLRQIAASAEASLNASEKGPGNGPDEGTDKGTDKDTDKDTDKGSGRGLLGKFKKFW